MMYSWLLYLLLDECIDSMEEDMENRFSVVDLEYRVGREFSMLEYRDYVYGDSVYAVRVV